ncbi:MAG: response regulator transcription factor [Acidobacteria bacterium]|nr:response regulator transcription factor [Acidobacteriota bacterium]
MTKKERAPRILLVEDEVHIARPLEFNLEQEGYEVSATGSGREALARYERRPFDLIILDIMLEDLDGFEVARRIRQSDPKVPVIMLTARAAPEDRVRGLELRADDYVVKPFHLRELLLRVRRMLERAAWYDGEGGTALKTTVGDWPVDLEELRGEGPRGGVQLTALEARLLRTLISAPNRVFSRRELLEKVWDYHSGVETRTVDNFIVRLRKHFEEEPEQPRHFVSLRGRGYKYVP